MGRSKPKTFRPQQRPHLHGSRGSANPISNELQMSLVVLGCPPDASGSSGHLKPCSTQNSTPAHGTTDRADGYDQEGIRGSGRTCSPTSPWSTTIGLRCPSTSRRMYMSMGCSECEGAEDGAGHFRKGAKESNQAR